MEEREQAIVRFEYRDIFGDLTELHKDTNANALEYNSEYDFLIDSFKAFLHACGFAAETVKERIK